MGCQPCKTIEKDEDQTVREVLKYIQNENLSSLNFFLKSLIRNSKQNREIILNEATIILNNFKLSFLSYALVAGSTKSFRFLHEKCGCSIELMNQNFASYGMSPLNIVCEKNHAELLKYYLPIFFRYRSESVSVMNSTIDFTNSQLLKEPKDPFTPIQVAVLNGSIAAVDILYNYNLSHPDPLINIELINEETGENCALIAIRSGSLAMVKLVFEKYKIDFNASNKFGESALQICAVSSAKHPNMSFDEIFIYLVEEVGLDPSVNYEEVLLVLDRKELILYYQKVLERKGITATKEEIENNFTSKNKSIRFIKPDNEIKPITKEERSLSRMSSIEKCSYSTPFSEASFAVHKNWLTNPN